MVERIRLIVPTTPAAGLKDSGEFFKPGREDVFLSLQRRVAPVGMGESCRKNQQAPLARLDAPVQVEEFRFPALLHRIEIEHSDEFAIRHVTSIFIVPLVKSLARTGALKLAVKMKIASLLKYWIALKIEAESLFAEAGILMIDGSNQAIVEKARCHAVEQGLTVANLLTALLALHHQPVALQVREELLEGLRSVVGIEASDEVFTDAVAEDRRVLHWYRQ
jgi:hypothetical protein